MQAIRVTQKLDSETLYLPQLRPLVGKDVEIIVLTVEGRSPVVLREDVAPNPLAGSVLRYDDPFELAASADEWEANR